MTRRQNTAPSPVEGTSAFTLRAFLLGSILAFVVSAGSAYGTLYLRGSFMALGTSTVGAMLLLAVLTGLINPLLKLIHPRASLNRQELLLIYIMMVVASPIPTLFVARFLTQIASPDLLNGALVEANQALTCTNRMHPNTSGKRRRTCAWSVVC